jgi:serine/threonine protein kinase
VSFRAATQTTQLGRYHVVKRLAAGGMADVLLARTDGIEGFQRHVVIKRIHSELLEEPRYVTMFLDEARLAASLHHHNIVQVNDIGEENGEYFFAMEYVHGEDARTLLVEASKRRELIPIEHVVTIIMAAASGLHHAHEQRGMDGAPLDIVHRDVSPANILVGYDGAVKVADFGIALAAHRAEQTQSGVLKGKVAYMSPEQCNCEQVDRRSDVFSLGIVLYELTTVRPCFAGDNDFMTMSAIVGGKIDKPSRYRKDLPPQLEAIMLKALARKASDRYQNADELRRALEQFAADQQLRTSTTALADYMKSQFGTKALPWQEDDDDPEMEMTTEVAGVPVVTRSGTPPRGSIPPPRGSVPVRTATPARGNVRTATPARGSTPKPTMPLRAVHDDLAIPSAGGDDDLSVPVGDGRTPTLEMVSLDMRPPAQFVVGHTPVSKRIDHRQVLKAKRQRRMWLAGSALAVLIAGLSLILVSAGTDKPTPRASAAPATRSPQPLERPTVTREAVEAATETSTPAPTKKSSKRVKKESTKPAPAKKWDPDALFPQ